MSSKPHGGPTFQVEVTNVSSHGLWLLAHGRELFLSFDDFPWFKDASIGSVLKVEEPSPGHFYWPDLDVDLGLETIENPERFPLKSRADA
ncbi:MAG: DUF2442 domain-containing protein [Gammaproteobacteria bacterium]|nr:DUF2442 domain-containing protein [Gammaproteobacteria bacterium]